MNLKFMPIEVEDNYGLWFLLPFMSISTELEAMTKETITTRVEVYFGWLNFHICFPLTITRTITKRNK